MEASRDTFHDQQAKRRQQRAARYEALRSTQRAAAAPPADSDEKFDIDEPVLSRSALHTAQLAAHAAYDSQRERFHRQREASRQAGKHDPLVP